MYRAMEGMMTDQFDKVEEVVDMYSDMNNNTARVWAIENSCLEELSVNSGGGEGSDDETVSSSSSKSR